MTASVFNLHYVHYDYNTDKIEFKQQLAEQVSTKEVITDLVSLGGKKLEGNDKRLQYNTVDVANLEDIPSLPLGTNEINIIEMAAGYSAFANLGYKVVPHFIEKVVDDDGNLLYEAENKKELVLNSSLVFILNNMLTATYDPDYIGYNYPTAVGLSSKLTHTYSLKSGTTNSDNWNIGYNKDALCAVWIGYDDNRSLNTTEYKYSQNIWYKTIEAYEYGKTNEDVWYDIPKNVSAVFVDPISGRPTTSSDTKQKLMYFIKGSEPRTTDPVFDEIFSEQYAT